MCMLNNPFQKPFFFYLWNATNLDSFVSERYFKFGALHFQRSSSSCFAMRLTQVCSNFLKI
jgi:hypothetical protein